MVREHERREKPFDPERPPTWHGSSRDLVTNPGGFKKQLEEIVGAYYGKLRTDLSEQEVVDELSMAFKNEDTSDALERANELLEGHGVEALGGYSGGDPQYLYVNFGDPYDPTILWSREDNKVFVAMGGWGSVWEEEGEGDAVTDAWDSYLRREFHREVSRDLENYDTPEAEAEAARFDDLSEEQERELFDKALRDAQQESRGSRYPEWEGSSEGYSLMYAEVVFAKAAELIRAGWQPSLSANTGAPPRTGATGWGGDPSRGAALGRDMSHGPADFDGRLFLERVRIDRGGYDPQGRYYGTGKPLFRVSDELATIDREFRAEDRKAAIAQVRIWYPRAKVR